MKKIVLLFPGQGSQYVGMGKALCEKSSIAKQTFEEANDTLGFDLKKLCFEGSMEELTGTENAQPALLTASIAAFRTYINDGGTEPSFVAGHSLGEISALACAGGIGFADAVKIVRQRGKLMQEAAAVGIGSMAAVSGLDRNIIEDECRKHSINNQVVVVSNYNTIDQSVISGHHSAVTAVSEKLKELGARITPLKVSAPFHSPLMQPVVDGLKEELEKYTYNTMKYPVLSNVTARPYEGHGKIIQNLTMQIVQPVRWYESMEFINNQGVEIALEVGPHTVLRNMMKKISPNIQAYSYDKDEDIQAFKKTLLPDEQPKKAVDRGPTVLTRCMAVAVCTRNTNWDNEEYQKGVVEPYKRIQQMQEELDKDGKQPSVEQMQEALEMLRSVFVTKRTPIEEQIERFNQIFDETDTRHLFSDFKMPD